MSGCFLELGLSGAPYIPTPKCGVLRRTRINKSPKNPTRFSLLVISQTPVPDLESSGSQHSLCPYARASGGSLVAGVRRLVTRSSCLTLPVSSWCVSAFCKLGLPVQDGSAEDPSPNLKTHPAWRAGSVKAKCAPLPTSPSALMLPPCKATMRCTRGSPTPVPGMSLSLCNLWNGAKIFFA